MSKLEEITQKVLQGIQIQKEEALFLATLPINEVAQKANYLREFFCKNAVDICAIINAKNGACSENCKFCAQSSFYNTSVEEYGYLPEIEIAKQADIAEKAGIMRFSLVCSGKKPNKNDMPRIAKSLENMRETQSFNRCASLGLLDSDEYIYLKQHGLERVHNNLETSEKFFSAVCSTHSFADKVASIKKAQKAGLEVCSGGIFGLGESLEDRLDMAFSLRELGIKSIPINILFPIKGTPFELNTPLTYDEIIQSIAIYRFILPDTFLRLAGGRKLLPDNGRRCFESGANALITGDMLTTSGVGIEEDKKMLKELGFAID